LLLSEVCWVQSLCPVRAWEKFQADEPSWPLRAAHELGREVADLWPRQYLRARPGV
jgi:hypothetical protein